MDLGRVGRVDMIKTHCMEVQTLNPENIHMCIIKLTEQVLFRDVCVCMHALIISENRD